MLRAAIEADIPQWVAIEAMTQKMPWSPESFEKCFQSGALGWVVEQADHTIIGFILEFIQLNECHILNIAVVPDQQCQGHGYRLLSHALIEAKKEGAHIAYLEVRPSNQHAIALYRKLSFEKIGERKNYYVRGEDCEDAWVFAKYL